MNYCKKCGSSLDERAVSCPRCGKRVPQNTYYLSGQQVQYYQDDSVLREKGSILWGLLGFLLPPVGLILYLAWKSKRPKSAGSAGSGALICVILVAICAAIYYSVMLGLQILF